MPVSIPESDVEKAVVARDGHGRRIMIVLWRDGHVSVCSTEDEKITKAICYISSKPEGKRLYYLAQAFYASLDFDIVPVVE